MMDVIRFMFYKQCGFDNIYLEDKLNGGQPGDHKQEKNS
jgi:hypothetical protein